MKYWLKVIVLFLSMCVLGTLVGALFVMLNYDIRMLIAGNDLTFFSADFFIRAIFVVFPCICVLSLALLIFYAIRHPSHPLALVLSYSVVCLLAWGGLLPLNKALSIAYEEAPLYAPVAEDLTPGYFRKTAGNIYYYARTFHLAKNEKDVFGEGLMIDLAGLRGKNGEIYSFGAALTVKPQNSFSDLIFMEAAKMPVVVEVPVAAYGTLHTAARLSWQGGVIPWIAFASIGLALFSVVFLRNVNSWRFLNASIVAAASILVLAVNAILYAHLFFSDLSLACSDLFFDVGYYLPDIFSGVARIREPLALFVNIGFVVLYALAGLFGRLIKKRRPVVAVYAEEADE